VPLYLQPWDGTGHGSPSQNDTSSLGNFATSYDNFTLASSAVINQIDFTGLYYAGTNYGYPISGFTVQFWDDSSGQPGRSLYSVHILGDGGETFVGTGSVLPGNYAYSYSLPVNFAANGGTQYWLSIVPDLPLVDLAEPYIEIDPWYWASGTGGDTMFYLDYGGGRSAHELDLAFTLEGGPSAVPLPSAGWLFGTALGGLVLLGRRSKRKQLAALSRTQIGDTKDRREAVFLFCNA